MSLWWVRKSDTFYDLITIWDSNGPYDYNIISSITAYNTVINSIHVFWIPTASTNYYNIICYLTHLGPVTPYADEEQCQHWFR